MAGDVGLDSGWETGNDFDLDSMADEDLKDWV